MSTRRIRQTPAENRRPGKATIVVTILNNSTLAALRKLESGTIRFYGDTFDGAALPRISIWVGANGGGKSVAFSSRAFCVRGALRPFSLRRWVARQDALRRRLGLAAPARAMGPTS